MDPIPCSRTPKWMLRPSNCPRAMSPFPLRYVSVEGSRSAEPPTSAGTSSAALCRTAPATLRVESILVEGGLRMARERDVVVVVEEDEVAEAQVAGERAGLARDSFHEVAVGADAVDVRVDDALSEAGGEHLLREREAHRIRESLSERTRGGLDAVRIAELRMARRVRMQLAELLQVIERDLEPREVQERVQQHRSVPRRQDEAVAARPARVARVEAQVPRPEHERHRRGAHGKARVP